MAETPISHRPAQMHPENSPNFQGAHGVIMMTETSKLLPWLMLCCVLSALALAFSLFAAASAWWSAKEAKQVQVQLMYQNAIMLREGMIHSGDMVYGPEGNLEYSGKAVKPKEK